MLAPATRKLSAGTHYCPQRCAAWAEQVAVQQAPMARSFAARHARLLHAHRERRTYLQHATRAEPLKDQ